MGDFEGLRRELQDRQSAGQDYWMFMNEFGVPNEGYLDLTNDDDQTLLAKAHEAGIDLSDYGFDEDELSDYGFDFEENE